MGRHLHREIEGLKSKMLMLFGKTKEMITNAVSAFEKSNIELAQKVLEDDKFIDSEEVEIEEDCLKILALNQPVANDLRHLVGFMKMNNDLERMADLAVNIAERGIYLAKATKVNPPFRFDVMAQKTINMLEEATRSLIDLNKNLALKVIADDQEVDKINREMYQMVFDSIKADPQNVASYIQYLAVSRHLERIADYTTNIAEDVIYMVEGRIIRHTPEAFMKK